MASSSFQKAHPGASLLVAFRLDPSRITLIVGSNSLAASRALSALEAGSRVVVLAQGGERFACEELKWRAAQGELDIVDLAKIVKDEDGSSASTSTTSYTTTDSIDPEITALESFLNSHQGSVAFVCIADTLLSPPPCTRRTYASALSLHRLCLSYNIPINVADMPTLCTFTFPSQHRFIDPHTFEPTPLQIAVATNGMGCRLGSRIRREIIARLHKETGVAVKKMGRLRGLAAGAKMARRKRSFVSSDVVFDAVYDSKSHLGANEVDAEQTDDTELCEESISTPTPNAPVPQRSLSHSLGSNLEESETDVEKIRRRMKWVAQISEYWSIPKLASLSEEDMEGLLDGNLFSSLNTTSIDSVRDDTLNNDASSTNSPSSSTIPSHHSLSIHPPKDHVKCVGRILLVGSGPGHPSLLTLAAHHALTSLASLVLTDKLVPQAILELIPKWVEVRVAKKFPGNAEGAQRELMEAAVEGYREGKVVIRLKQGDPMLYGRAGEEIIYFRAHGIQPIIIPGISSALAAPMFANIPVTQRGVADALDICTGVGRGGKEGRVVGYRKERTVVIMMGVARLGRIVDGMMRGNVRCSRPYPPYTPVAIIERGSMPDQRVVASTLEHIEEALISSGEQRPPGLMVVGWAVLALWPGMEDEVKPLIERDEEKERTGQEDLLQLHDVKKIKRWMNGKRWHVVEGLQTEWLEIFEHLGVEGADHASIS